MKKTCVSRCSPVVCSSSQCEGTSHLCLRNSDVTYMRKSTEKLKNIWGESDNERERHDDRGSTNVAGVLQKFLHTLGSRLTLGLYAPARS